MACGAKGGGFFYVFPDGRFVPRWTPWLAITIALLLVPDIFFPDSGVIDQTMQPAQVSVAAP